MKEPAWESFHLFRGLPWEQFLCDDLASFVTSVRNDGLVTSFFFVRYYDRGPHVRLRLKTADGKEVARRVESHFGELFRRSPSKRIDPPGVKWHSNDAVLRAAYEPEVERYGGPLRIPLAERQFEASSRAVLELINPAGWSYDRALGAAIQLHLIFAHSIGMSIADTRRFLSEAADLWCGSPKNMNIHRFAASFASQRTKLVTAHRRIWNALTSGDQFEEQWANDWAAAAAAFRGETRPAAPRNGKAFGWQERAILRSLVHMTNNRLGIMNRDEAYLAFVMKQSFSHANATRNRAV